MYYYVMDGRLYRDRSTGAILEWGSGDPLDRLGKSAIDRLSIWKPTC